AITYALWKLDAAVVPLDPELAASEIDQVSERMHLTAVIDASGGPGWRAGECPGIGRAYYVMRQKRGPAFETDIHMAFIRFTSGTTGERKGVVLSHERIAQRIEAVNRGLAITAADTILWVLSMTHHFVSTIVLYLSQGATIVIADGFFSSRLLETIREQNVSVIYAAPFHYALLAADRSDCMMPGVRMAISTAIELPEQIYRDFHERFHLPLTQAYGIIEAGLVCINTERPAEKPGSVGRPLPDYRLEIRNTRKYRDDTRRVSGELFFKGPGFFDAYFDPWQSADAVLDNGWFETGDIGWTDAEGFVFLRGRKTNVINMAGMKVFPQELEVVLNAHPQVRESVVYSQPHERFGNVVAARVVLHDADAETQAPVSASELKAFLRARVAGYKVPGEVVFTDRIEKTPLTSKIVRPSRAEP
ncbi:MAG: class I adenylate-forming enzyme family protein, partial [Thermodesulfobacteriota bacterium]